MQMSSEDALCKDELDISMLSSSFFFCGETEAEELTAKCFQYPTECFQPEVITQGKGEESMLVAWFMASGRTVCGSSLYCPAVLVDPLKLSTM